VSVSRVESTTRRHQLSSGTFPLFFSAAPFCFEPNVAAEKKVRLWSVCTPCPNKLVVYARSTSELLKRVCSWKHRKAQRKRKTIILKETEGLPKQKLFPSDAYVRSFTHVYGCPDFLKIRFNKTLWLHCQKLPILLHVRNGGKTTIICIEIDFKLHIIRHIKRHAYPDP